MSKIITLADVEREFGATHLDHLDREAELPTVDQLGFQGDVAVIRDDDATPSTTPVPAQGYPVVKGENGGNTHALFGAHAFYTPSPTAGTDPSDLDLGVLTVPEGPAALLSHPEHGGLLVAPGTYTLRRQREQADVERFVRD